MTVRPNPRLLALVMVLAAAVAACRSGGSGAKAQGDADPADGPPRDAVDVRVPDAPMDAAGVTDGGAADAPPGKTDVAAPDTPPQATQDMAAGSTGDAFPDAAADGLVVPPVNMNISDAGTLMPPPPPQDAGISIGGGNLPTAAGRGGSPGAAVEVCRRPGAEQYLAQLRCSDGNAPIRLRRNNVGPRHDPPDDLPLDERTRAGDPDQAPGPVDYHIVDLFTLRCAQTEIPVYVDIYHCAGTPTQPLVRRPRRLSR
jgi:hypothetical protein